MTNTGDVYLSSLPLSLSLILWAVLHPTDRPNWCATIGREDSLYIYVFHLLIWNLSWAAVNKIIPAALHYYEWCAAPIVLLLTIVAIRLWRAAKRGMLRART